MFGERYTTGARYDLSALDMLVVEDNANMQKLLAAILRGIGICNIRQAYSGQQGLEILREYAADIVITDSRMEPMDGIAFTRALRHAPDSPNRCIPIIMVTGATEQAHVIEARDAGVNYFLAKPVSAKALADRIIALIDDPQDFVRTKDYFGPDRRRRSASLPDGFEDRRTKIAEAPKDSAPAPWRDTWVRSS